MGARDSDQMLRKWYQGGPTAQRRPYGGQFAASKKAFLGSVCMQVAGIAMPLLGGASLVALCTTIAGADANGGVVLRSRQAGVTVQLAGGNDKVLGVTSITYGASTIAVLIQQGTDNGGAVTTTAAQMCNLIRSHTELSKLLACKPTGTGAGLTATAGATAIAHLEVLGVPERQIDNAANGSALTLLPSMVFHVGKWGMAAVSGEAPTIFGSSVFLANDAEISKAADPLNFRVPLVAIENGFYFVDLGNAE